MARFTTDYLMQLAQLDNEEQKDWLSRVLSAIEKDPQSHIPAPTALAPQVTKKIIKDAVKQYMRQRADIPIEPRSLLKRLKNLVYDLQLAKRSPLGENPYFSEFTYEGLVYHPEIQGSYTASRPPLVRLVAPSKRFESLGTLSHELTHGVQDFSRAGYFSFENAFYNLPPAKKHRISEQTWNFLRRRFPNVPYETLREYKFWMTDPKEIMANAVAEEVTRRLFGRVDRHPIYSFSARLADHVMNDLYARSALEAAIDLLTSR